MKPLKDSVSITLDSDLLKKVRELAERDGRSLSQYIDMVLKKHVLAISNQINDPQKNEHSFSV